MTTPDLRAAAERVRRVRQGGNPYRVYMPEHPAVLGTGRWTDEFEREFRRLVNDDRIMLANAHVDYLSSHPPDGETEIDEAWLVLLGMDAGVNVFLKSERGQDWYWSVSMTSMAPIGGSGWHFRGNYYKAKEGQEEIVKFVKTRSDLRGLCAALGIPLKEEQSNG